MQALAALVVLLLAALSVWLVVTSAGGAIRVRGPGTRPQIGFACCEHGMPEAQSLLGDAAVVADLRSLGASVAIPIQDLSPERAALVRRLNQEEVPVVAWIVLPPEQGYYLTADNEPEAAARVAAFEQWTRAQGLHWVAVGLDIEPNFGELARLRTHRLKLFETLLARAVSGGRIERAQASYEELIRQIRAHGWPVQIYEMPFIPAERSVHSTLADQVLGTVDARGDEDYLMIYTSFARPVDGAMIWKLGKDAWGIVVGVTDGPGPAGVGQGPLDWDEFSRDLIVASHFTRHIGVYDLEGCVQQGMLPRLLTMDWARTVTIPASSLQRAEWIGLGSRSVLWVLTNLGYLLGVAVLALVALILWRRKE